MVEFMAQLRWFLIAQALTYTVTVGSTVPFEQWQCGADQETRQLAYDSSRQDCLAVMGQLNNCCIVHDQCYVDQLGRYKCDEDFCHCMSNAAKNASNADECESSTGLACMSVHLFGAFAYAEAEKEGKTKALSSTTLATTVAETHKTSTAKSSTESPKTTRVPIHKVTTTKIPVTSPSTTTKHDSHVCNVEDAVLKQWYKNTMANCPEYQDEVGECCADHTACMNNMPTSPMLCPTQFIECLLRKVRPLRNDRKCYETILMMHNELASNLYKYKGLSARIQGWIGGLGDSAVNVQSAVRNTLGKDPWRKVVLMTLLFAFAWTLAYAVFFTNLLDKARWRITFKLIPEKARLIQVNSTGQM